MNVTHECQILIVLMEVESNYNVNNQFKPLRMQNSPYDGDQDTRSVSECDSVNSNSKSVESKNFGNGLVGLWEGDKIYEIIKNKFVSGLGSNGMLTDVVSIRRIIFSSGMEHVKAQSFEIFAREMEKKRGVNEKKYAWYGGPRDEIFGIVTHGFSLRDCIYLAPANSSIDSVKSAIADEDGLKHVLLGRVIMGKAEKVRVGSKQSHPSSEEFDSGVDNLISPNKYIIWSSRMNTHILPEFLISFRTRLCSKTAQEPSRLPKSPWMSFRPLISALSKFLPHEDIVLISKFYDDYVKKKISRHELIRQVRKIAGETLLVSVLKSFGNKKHI